MPARVMAAALVAGTAGVAVAGVLLNPSTLPPGGVKSETGTPGPSPATPGGATATNGSAGTAQDSPPASAGDLASISPQAISQGEQRVISWQDRSGSPTAQVLVSVRNDGSAPVRVDATSSTYVLKALDGREVGRGVFSYAFPPILDAGAVGYLLDSPLTGLVPIGNKDTATVNVDATTVSGTPTDLEVTDLRWRKDSAGGISVSGTVRNPGAMPVRNGAIGVVLRDREGRLLAALYDPIDIANMPPMSTRTFNTGYPGTPTTLNPDVIGSAEGFAFDLSR